MLVALMAASLCALAAGPAAAAVMSVNCAPFGADDLQAAINAAAPGDTLLIKGICTGSLDSQGQVFTASQNVTLQGAAPGATLNGGGLSNTLAVFGATVTIRNLTITGGGGLAGHGGGIYIDGGATVTVVNSTVRGNTSSVVGGGIFAFASTLNLTNSTVSGNTTTFGGGGIFAFASTVSVTGSIVSGNSSTDPFEGGAGGIDSENGGTLTLNGTTVTGNTTAGGAGGGITNGGGVLTLTNSSVDHNTTECCAGGGIFNDSFPSDATLTIKNSTVSFNRTLASSDGGEAFFAGGGGIFNFAESGGSATLVATGLTMTGNTAPNGHGGAIDNGNFDGTAAQVTIAQSKIGPANSLNPNQAIFGGGIYNDGTFGPTSLSLQPGTIITHNQATNDGGGVYSTGANASLSIAPGVVILFNSPNNVS